MSLEFRFIDHGLADGATNMAIDEALLDAYAGTDSPRAPTLRLYGWSPPALSLGRRQPADGSHDPDFLARHGIDLVRRPSGGRAVLHEHEVTYALVGRLAEEPFPGGVHDTYGRISEALTAALRRVGAAAMRSHASARDPGPFGPPVCFDRAGAHEIVVGTAKLVGSAQLRRRGAFLQHGSILLRADPARLAAAVGAPADAPRLVDLETALGGRIDEARLRVALREAFETTLGCHAVAGALSASESEAAARLLVERYRSPEWTLRGRCGRGVELSA